MSAFIDAASLRPRAWCAAIVAALSLAACGASPVAEADQPVVVRVLVKLVRSSDDGAAISSQASRLTSVPVTYAASTGSDWHALALRCATAAICDAAVERLRHAAKIYEAVEIDGRKQRMTS
jgi:hypothetical protein